MPSAVDLLTFSLIRSRDMLLGFTGDLSPAEMVHRPVPQSNCAAWLIGHLTLTDRRILSTMLGVTDLPALPEGFEKRFARDAEAPKAADYGDVSALGSLFAAHRNLLIETVGKASPEVLDRKIDPPHPRFSTVAEAVAFMALHVILHVGQISTIRRSLGRPPLV
jgi:uncharacterized damage-inducible protein DinB